MVGVALDARDSGAVAEGTPDGARQLAIDAAGNIFTVDQDDHTVRKVTAAGVVSTAVGAAGENGNRLGMNPRLSQPFGIVRIGASRFAITTPRAVLIVDVP